jgi:uncharacterized protein YbjT (DUF2867 family)
MFVVTGATGNTGAVVAQQLLAAGRKVRVYVRDAAKASALAEQGAEVRVGDLDDERALSEAARGAEGVYVLAPPDPRSNAYIAEREQLTGKIARALSRAEVKHVVLLSSIAAQLPSGTGPIVTVHNAEQQLRASGVPATFVRASYFMENWASVLPVAQRDGVLPAFFPADLRIAQVATRDIGAVAARALLDGPRGIRILELSGPRELSPADVARAAANVFGRPVSVAEAPLDAVVPTLTGFGISPNFAALFRELYAGVCDGTITWEGTGEAVRGVVEIEQALRELSGAR